MSATPGPAQRCDNRLPGEVAPAARAAAAVLAPAAPATGRPGSGAPGPVPVGPPVGGPAKGTGVLTPAVISPAGEIVLGRPEGAAVPAPPSLAAAAAVQSPAGPAAGRFPAVSVDLADDPTAVRADDPADLADGPVEERADDPAWESADGAGGDPAGSPVGAEPVAGTDQAGRIRAEVTYLLERIRRQAAGTPQAALVETELAWWRAAAGRTLVEQVRRGFAVRQLCLRLADSDGTWRNAISYIGDLDPADESVCTYDYDRAEIRYTAGSTLATPYGWTGEIGADVTTWYARTGMSAIAAWLLAVSRVAQDGARRCTVLTNRLYHETTILFELSQLTWVQVRTFDDVDALLAAAATVKGPATVFLDSSRPDGHAAAVRRVLRAVDPDRFGCVVWDNTCAPADEHPFTDGFAFGDMTTSLLLLRSHAKLDQLGLEFTALGTLALLTGPGIAEGARPTVVGLKNYLPDALAVSGGCASPPTLRLLDALGLPERALVARGNEVLRAANVLAGRLLKESLEPGGRYAIEENEHRCFVEIHVLDLPGPPDFGAPPDWEPWTAFDALLTEMERVGAERDVPIWKSASFGFHYTGLSWYSGEDPPHPHGHRHTVLRLCVGMHDPAEVRRVVDVVSEHLLARPDWVDGG
jgi:hypothetical protein